MKKILLIIFAFIATLGMVSGASFYTTYQVNFPNDQPTSLLVSGGECSDNSCATINSNIVEIYDATIFNTCDQTNVAAFNSCVATAKISGSITNIAGDGSKVVTKITTPTTFGYVTWFSTQGDTYIPKFDRATNYVCNFDVCINPNTINLDFTKKANAIANIGQLNIKNVDNDNLPVQISVPVSIDETVCSAYQLTNSNMYVPSIPSGYSDFSANTLISLDITKVSDGSSLLSKSINLPIKADTCAGLTAFSWTPSSGLTNENVKFKVTTEVIDNQVSSTTKDFAEVIENIYPSDLTGSCWAKAYDFTLANTATQTMTPANTQINKITSLGISEDLFATFTGGAFRDAAITPMDFEAIVKVDGTVISQKLFNSGANIKTYTTDLTSAIKNTAVGSHLVTLTAKPIGSSCTISDSVVLNSNLEITEEEVLTVKFHVTNNESQMIPNANITLNLLSIDGTYNTPIVYTKTISTNNFGIAEFSDVLAGDYKYEINKAGVGSNTGNTHIGSDTDLYITLYDSNRVPVIDLPSTLTGYYKNSITIDLKKYVIDSDDDFNSLNFTTNVLSGNINVNLDNNGIVTIMTKEIGRAQLKINVKDPSGNAGTDTVSIDFNDNKPSVINLFSATPTNGKAPFSTTFNVDISNVDSDNLSCNLDFGDGTSVSDSGTTCSSLNGLVHTYNLVGTYNAELSVDDGSNPVVTANQNIFVYNQSGPIVKSFTIASSNGALTPTDLTIDWNVIHSDSLSMTCTLRVNNVDSPVNCISNTSINNYNITGISSFSIIAVDTDGTQEIQTIDLALAGESNLAETSSLIMDDVLVPGKFKFIIRIDDEIFKLRTIKLSPSIICNNVKNNYNDKVLDISLISKSNKNKFSEFEVTMDTLNFVGAVATDITCQFNIVLFDNIGLTSTLTHDVMFSYPIAAQGLTSIRGRGTDIANYMSSSLFTPFSKGYNTLDFIVKNNEQVGKELRISFTSSNLGINYVFDENIASGQDRRIQIPIYVGDNTKAGKYPVRISVADGLDKQTRYSYIIIK